MTTAELPQYKVIWNGFHYRQQRLAQAPVLTSTARRQPCVVCMLPAPCVRGICAQCSSNPQETLSYITSIVESIEKRLDAAHAAMRTAEQAANAADLAAFDRMLLAEKSNAPDYTQKRDRALAHPGTFGALVRAYVSYSGMEAENQRLADLAVASRTLEDQVEGNKE